ncbi:MAG: peptide ABC transporter substrate-binding protein [Solobacterium sp.]|nr:peptide ABC transporter substrate-binding protein [Solobacterium sp.]
MTKYVKKLAAGLMALALVACSNGGGSAATPTPASTSGTETQAPAAEPGYKTTFTFAIGGEPTYLDPSRTGDSVTAEVTNQIWDTLFILGEDGSPVPSNCIDWSVSDDGLIYTFKLDPNGKWSDGEPLTAEHYVFGIKRCIGMGYDNVGFLEFITKYVKNAEAHVLDDVANMDDVGVRAVDDFTLEIELFTLCPFFTSLTPAIVYAAQRPEFSTEHDSEWSSTPGYPTTGAFYPTKIDAASEFILKKNEYFAHADEVSVDEMIIKVMPSMEASQMAFRTGEIDYDTSAGSDVVNIPDLKDNIVIAGNVNYYISINCYESNPALNDVRVRRAIQLGIDRSAFVTALDAGEVFYELNGFIPHGLPGINGDFRTESDNTEKLVYTDKDEARALMEEAGFSETNRLALEYSYNQNSMHDTVAAVITEQLKDIYIDVTLKTSELRTFFDDRSYGRYDICRNAYSADYMDPYNFMALMDTSNNTRGIFFGDDYYNQQLAETFNMTGDERLQAFHDLEHYAIAEQCWNCPIFGYGDVSLQKTGTTGVIVNPQGTHYFMYVKCPE